MSRGLSPRVRGNPVGLAAQSSSLRSIPACAGEPPSLLAVSRMCAVYPRVCGGTDRRTTSLADSIGLSPRVRGNPAHSSGPISPARSIPACAGEPFVCHFCSPILRVYPRVCGGTSIRANRGAMDEGLSPRVRGNPTGAGSAATLSGSIPACAGEPGLAGERACNLEVYPRVCGGTMLGLLGA